MTEQTNAEVIAEARDVLSRPIRADHESEEARGVIQRLIYALEAADRRAVQAEAELRDAFRTDIPSLKDQRNQLAAVVEKAEDYVTRHYFDTQMGTNVLTMLVGGDPADALREVKADVWVGGYRAGYSDRGAPGEPFTRNPYRQAKRVLMTHPHDGHDLGDTCLDCQRREEQS